MPLSPGKSKKAFSHNVKAEMKAGKPQKQALAIAYSMARRPKKMAHGGISSLNKKLHPGRGHNPMSLVAAVMAKRAKKDK